MKIILPLLALPLLGVAMLRNGQPRKERRTRWLDRQIFNQPPMCCDQCNEEWQAWRQAILKGRTRIAP